MFKKNFKRVFVSLLTATIVFEGISVYAETESAQAFTAKENDGEQMGGMKQGRRGNGPMGGNEPMGGTMNSDPEIQSVLDEMQTSLSSSLTRMKKQESPSNIACISRKTMTFRENIQS